MIEIDRRVRGLVNMVDDVEHTNRNLTIFVELSKTHEATFRMKHGAVPPRNFWEFLFNCCFKFSYLEAVLL